jgi:hypothetical protein
MLMRAARTNLISGLLPQAEPGVIISLQYVDDTLLFSDDTLLRRRRTLEERISTGSDGDGCQDRREFYLGSITF